MNLNELTISKAATGLRRHEFSVTELVSDCLTAVKKEDGKLHAYLEIFDDVSKEAQRADELLSDPHFIPPPLFGIPIAIKDNILIGRKRCSAGSKILENYKASYDATVISKLKKQGAIFFGKTNLDEFAMGSSTENSAFGPTKNPHDLMRVPGGSSGGSAAAVAANMCLAALGSDTGGSIRQPASFCGITGLKPTYGTVSRHGLIAMASSLDQIGPMTKSVEDARILLGAIAGNDFFDSTSSRLEVGNWKLEIPENLKNFRVGVPKEYFDAGLDPEIEKIIKSALEKIEKAGAKIEEISLPHSKYALPCYYIIAPSEISANLARYDGIKYGESEIRNPRQKRDSPQAAKSETMDLYDVYSKTRAMGLGAEVKRRIMLGTYALSHGYYDAYYLKAQKIRRLIREDFKRAFEKVDVIVGPTTPTPAFKFGERASDPLKMYLADIYTVAINLAGVPALSIPAGFVEYGDSRLPIGLQLVGKWFGENNLLYFAQGVEKILKGLWPNTLS